MQGIFALILLCLALLIYWWGRRTSKPRITKKIKNSPSPVENPDVVLGLTPKEEPIPPQKIEPLRVMLFLRANPNRPYGGYELLQSLLSSGLRFGEMNIFHRFQTETDKILFSVAAATASGQLIPGDMGEFSCLGLSLFLTLDGENQGHHQFELMLDTARQLTEDLGGVILDENQKLLTSETTQLLEENIKHFEARQQSLELVI